MEGRREVSGAVTLTFRYAEAVVLSDMLARWERHAERLPLKDSAERAIWWDLNATFEPLIDEVFDGQAYARVVAASRAEQGGSQAE
jgi:hypothetical protein